MTERLMPSLRDQAAVELGKAIESGRWQKCLRIEISPKFGYSYNMPFKALPQSRVTDTDLPRRGGRVA